MLIEITVSIVWKYCVYGHTYCHGRSVEVRGQFGGNDSLLLLCVFWRAVSGHRTGKLEPFYYSQTPSGVMAYARGHSDLGG